MRVFRRPRETQCHLQYADVRYSATAHEPGRHISAGLDCSTARLLESRRPPPARLSSWFAPPSLTRSFVEWWLVVLTVASATRPARFIAAPPAYLRSSLVVNSTPALAHSTGPLQCVRLPLLSPSYRACTINRWTIASSSLTDRPADRRALCLSSPVRLSLTHSVCHCRHSHRLPPCVSSRVLPSPPLVELRQC